MDVTRIRLRYLFDVNCYLVAADDGYVLIDTGIERRRLALDAELKSAGCGQADLRLIILTHAHTDHAGNCAYLREKYGAQIAMHPADAGKAERGDMFWSPTGPTIATRFAKAMISLVGAGKFESFRPDVLLGDGQSLDEYGLNATVLHLPGHSPGSLGVLSESGEFFCGDILTNARRPMPTTLVENASDLEASIERIRRLKIETAYPGHGAPFPIGLLSGTE